jgi:hypothetical protein
MFGPGLNLATIRPFNFSEPKVTVLRNDDRHNMKVCPDLGSALVRRIWPIDAVVAMLIMLLMLTSMAAAVALDTKEYCTE